MTWKSMLLVGVLGWSGWAYALCVKDHRAVLRSGPSRSQAVTWVAGKNTPLYLLDRKGDWYHVRDVDGESHYIQARSVSKNINCVTVRTNTSYLFTGPGYKYPRAGLQIADRYTPFRKVETKRDWIRVADEMGHKFWLNGKNVWP